MRHILARPIVALAGAAALAACVSETAAPLLPPLAQDRAQPALALIEHALAEHFARQHSPDPPTTCVALSPAGLTAAQEEALIARFPRLAPRTRCETEVPPPSDGITGERAVVLQVYDLQCQEARCTGWLSRNGRPAMRYTLAYEGGAWRISGEQVSAQ